jgi:hypothetical protein
MIETAIAIIATCLPALRSMILGKGTTNNSDYGRHYELSAAQRRASENHLTAKNANSGIPMSRNTRSRTTGSQDSLFSDGHLETGDANAAGKITVNTEIETKFEDTESTSSSSKAKSPFN